MSSLLGSSLNGSSNPKPTVNTLGALSNPTSKYSPYFQFLIIPQLCCMIILSFLLMPMTIGVYMLPFAYSILQLTINLANIFKTVGVYSKSPPFVFPSSYLMLPTYMMSESFVSFLLILSGFVSRTLIVNTWASRFFPHKLV